MNNTKILAIAVALLGVSAAGQASTIVSTSGSITQIAAPADVNNNVFESDLDIFVFEEQKSVTGASLASPIYVDDIPGGAVSPGSIGGKPFDSYFLHFDPVGMSDLTADVVNLTGSITFSTPILGLIWGGVSCVNCPPTSEYLDSSDWVGNPATTYPTGGLGRGLELEAFYATLNGTQDFISVSPDGYTLTLDLSAQPLRFDQVRVLTAVPVPAAVWLMLSGFVALVGTARRRK